MASSAAQPARRCGDVVFADTSVVMSRTVDPDGVMLAGEIDVANSRSIADALRRAFPDGNGAHLDLSGVSFCDVSGIRVLIRLARELGPGRKLLLHGLPAQLESVMRVTGWADLPGLEICNCEDGA